MLNISFFQKPYKKISLNKENSCDTWFGKTQERNCIFKILHYAKTRHGRTTAHISFSSGPQSKHESFVYTYLYIHFKMKETLS